MQERERESKKRGGDRVRGYDILENGQQQIFFVDFGFTVKQTSKNVKNILRKTFHVETNKTLNTFIRA